MYTHREERERGAPSETCMLLALLATLALSSTMSDDEHIEWPDSCVVHCDAQDRAAMRCSFNPQLHSLDAADLELSDVPLRGGKSPADSCATQRGKHSRETASKRLSHADQAFAFMKAIEDNSLAGACSLDCTHACAHNLTRNEMLECLSSSYGTTKWVSAETLKVSAVHYTFLSASTRLTFDNATIICSGGQATDRCCVWQGNFQDRW